MATRRTVDVKKDVDSIRFLEICINCNKYIVFHDDLCINCYVPDWPDLSFVYEDN